MPQITNPTQPLTPAKPRRLAHKKRRQDILEVARVLLSEDGYEALSLRKVASGAGIHLKTLQHYFPTKEDLIQSTLEFTDALYMNATDAILAKDHGPLEHFEQYLRYLLDDHTNRQTAGFFYQLWARAHVDEKTSEVMGKIYNSHVGNLERLMKAINPDVPLSKRKQRAVIVAALLEGLMLFVGYGKKCPANAKEVKEETIELCKHLARGSAGSD